MAVTRATASSVIIIIINNINIIITKTASDGAGARRTATEETRDMGVMERRTRGLDETAAGGDDGAEAVDEGEATTAREAAAERVEVEDADGVSVDWGTVDTSTGTMRDSSSRGGSQR